ncbi:hypothetical protein E3Q23_00202 [Wallemia mellicola]|uniref:Uncharacterized protein n=1 Tax=Wallemia mellicola TaxID=1708541 RepID=A0A4T0RB00_9BASI|nr:hypothetical protein E3Q23_00202 [Wallemia mellicola]TIC34581.1 hypothetical protein E3Q10_00205 [Wallemia mellicola]
MRRSTSGNVNKPTPPVPRDSSLADKPRFQEAVKIDTKKKGVTPVEPAPKAWRISTLVRKFTIFFILYSFAAHFFCSTPITPSSSDICQRHQTTIDYFEPYYNDIVQPYVQQAIDYTAPHRAHATEKLAPVTNQLVKLAPVFDKAKKSARRHYNTRLAPRVEIQRKRLAQKLAPYQARAHLLASEYHSKYFVPVVEDERIVRLNKLSNDLFTKVSDLTTTGWKVVEPHARVVFAYVRRTIYIALDKSWEAAKTHGPPARRLAVKYTKRGLAEWIAFSQKTTSWLSRHALTQYTRMGLDQKLVNVDHIKALKVKFLDPVLAHLAEWVAIQRNNSAHSLSFVLFSFFKSNARTIPPAVDELGEFLKSMGEPDPSANEVFTPEPTTEVVEEVVDPAQKLSDALSSLNSARETLINHLDKATQEFKGQLSSMRIEKSSEIRQKSDKAIAEMEADFTRLVKGFGDYYESELAKIVDGDLTKDVFESNTANVRRKVVNKLRELSQSSLDYLVNWQNEIDNDETNTISESLNDASQHLRNSQREIGSLFAWTDGITYQNWQEYHGLAALFDSQLDQLREYQEESDDLEVLFELLFERILTIERQSEAEIEQVGKVSTQIEDEEQVIEDEKAEENEDEKKDEIEDEKEDEQIEEQVEEFENSQGKQEEDLQEEEQDVDTSTEVFNDAQNADINETSLPSDLEEDEETEDGTHGTIYHVAETPTASAEATHKYHEHQEL